MAIWKKVRPSTGSSRPVGTRSVGSVAAVGSEGSLRYSLRADQGRSPSATCSGKASGSPAFWNAIGVR